MHTAHQLEESLFAVRIDGEASTRAAVLPDWGPLDRIGVVVHEPFGGVGASLLIRLAITAFYDERPTRRADVTEEGDPRAVYPETYLFHVGGRHGDHAVLDIWPARKEVFVDDDPLAVLAAINDRGITRLVVPDGIPVPVEHEWKEPAQARDRITSAFLYSATGQVENADVEIEGLKVRTEANVKNILYPEPVLRTVVAHGEHLKGPDNEVLRQRRWEARALARAGEAQEGLELARERRKRITNRFGATESYQRSNVDDLLQLLTTASARPA